MFTTSSCPGRRTSDLPLLLLSSLVVCFDTINIIANDQPDQGGIESLDADMVVATNDFLFRILDSAALVIPRAIVMGQSSSPPGAAGRRLG